MTRRFLIAGLATLAILMALPEDASAQYRSMQRPRFGQRHRPHTYISGNIYGFGVGHSPEEYLGAGGGGGVTVGFRINPWLSIEGNGSFGYHAEETRDGIYLDSLWMMMLSADVKVHIPTYGPIEPYLQGGLGFAYLGAVWGDGYGGDELSDAFASGPMFNLGGGADLWLGPQFSVGARLLYRGIRFSAPDESAYGAAYTSGVSLDLNATLHF